MTLWRWLLGAVAGIAALAALLWRRRADPSRPATGAGVDPIRAHTAAQEAEARAAHEREQAARDAERRVRDDKLRQEAAREVQDDPVDRANARVRGRQ